MTRVEALASVSCTAGMGLLLGWGRGSALCLKLWRIDDITATFLILQA